jgi:hypothetical protein
MKKFGIFIIFVVLVVGAFVVYRMQRGSAISPIGSTTLNITPATTPVITPTPSVLPTTGSTDTDLDKDSQDVSTKLNAVNSDATSIDQGLNDQQGNLSEQ